MFLRWTRTNKWLYAAEVNGKIINDNLSLTFYFGPNEDPTSGGDKKTIQLSGTKAEEVVLVQESVYVTLNISWLNPIEPANSSVNEAIKIDKDDIKFGHSPLISISGNIVEGDVANVAIDSLLIVDIG